MHRVTAVVVAWGAEPLLGDCIAALLGSVDAEVDVVVVDNGCTDGAVELVRRRSGVTVLDPGENTGFARGCNLGAAAATGDVLAFVNGDVLVSPTALARLVAALTDDVAMATASIRLMDDPDTVNSAGNPLHWSGLSWAGGLGEPAASYDSPRDVLGASGAACAIDAERFAELGGFYEDMFAYYEDTELSLRCWQRGWRVVYVPEAVVLHRYEFARHAVKNFLLERNRLLLVLTTYQARTLTLLAPALMALEVACLLLAFRQGWAGQKIRGWWWLLRHRQQVVARRATTQATRTVSDRSLWPLLAAEFTPGPTLGLPAPRALNRLSVAYWRALRGFLPSATTSELIALDDGSGTAGSAYADRLVSRSGARWKRVLDVQRPYRWNLRRLDLGRTLDVGCGIGRNLRNLGPGSVGVDHNAESVAVARAGGLDAWTTQDFWASDHDRHASFDSLLVAHVMEHMSAELAEQVVAEYLPCLRPGGRLVFITPQEVGFRSDTTHVRFVDHASLAAHATSLGLQVERAYSFPFPRLAGSVFTHNEFVLVARSTDQVPLPDREPPGRLSCASDVPVRH